MGVCPILCNSFDAMSTVSSLSSTSSTRRLFNAGTLPARAFASITADARSCDAKQLAEIGDVEHLLDGATAIAEHHALARIFGALPQEQQHAQRRAVEIFDSAEVDLELPHILR